MPTRTKILVVDDHVEMARLLADQLSDAGYEVALEGSGTAGLESLRRSTPDLVVTDLRMEGVDGLDLLDAAHAIDPEIPVIVMTAFGAVESAVEAIKRGAYHYISKPLRLDELKLFVERALSERRMRAENRDLRRQAAVGPRLGQMVGHSGKMRALFDLCQRVGLSPAPVLIRGESGTGKELVARAIHDSGERRERPFVAVNCTALPSQLLESELFGHVRGAFTGATTPRRGLFLEADRGTLFLDEIGDMELALQAKVLRVLEDGQVRAVGSDANQRVDVRIVAATNQDLEARVRDGSFREDLFYRLNVVPIFVPALRERPEDIPELAQVFLDRARQRNPHSPARELTGDLIAALARRRWPGNVRELENLLERLVVIARDPVIDVGDLEALSDLAPAGTPIERARGAMVPLKQLEADYMSWVIDQCGGNKTRAAEILGVDVSTIHRRMRGSQ